MSPQHKLRAGAVSLDSNIILDLYLTGRLGLLVDLFAGRMLVSDFVLSELTQAAIELPGAQAISLGTDEEWQFFEQVRRRHPGMGVGEVGAITVARFRQATLITNDMQARQTAEDLELPVSGSIGVLECGVELAVISGQEAVNLLQAMIREGAWISDELLQMFRQKVLAHGHY
jgi:predicted nucleic acid-binding protein